jgi:hypothetical protein
MNEPARRRRKVNPVRILEDVAIDPRSPVRERVAAARALLALEQPKAARKKKADADSISRRAIEILARKK